MLLLFRVHVQLLLLRVVNSGGFLPMFRRQIELNISQIVNIWEVNGNIEHNHTFFPPFSHVIHRVIHRQAELHDVARFRHGRMADRYTLRRRRSVAYCLFADWDRTCFFMHS